MECAFSKGEGWSGEESYVWGEGKRRWWVGMLLSKCNGCATIKVRQRSIELIRHKDLSFKRLPFLFPTFAVSLSINCCFSFKHLQFPFQTFIVSLLKHLHSLFQTFAVSLSNIPATLSPKTQNFKRTLMSFFHHSTYPLSHSFNEQQ